MEYQFEKLVESLLNEISQPNPPVSDPAWSSNKPAHPQAGYGDSSAGLRSRERNAGLEGERVMVSVKVTWAGSGKQDYLKNPTTKEVISFDASKKRSWLDKLENMKAAGKITDFKFIERLA